jgi:O-antigen/teichoic acid export membrane protein
LRERLLGRLGGSGVRRLAERSGWSLGGTVVVTLCVFAETILLARHLGVDLYGVFLLVVAFPEAVLQVLDLRVKDAINKYLTEALTTGEHRRAVALLKLFWLLDVAVGLLCLLIVVALSRPVADLLTGDPDNAHLMVIFAFGLLLGTLDAATGSVLRVLDRFRLAFITGSIGIAARLALVAAVVVAGGGIEAVVWARVAGELAITLAIGSVSVVLLKRLLWQDRCTPMAELGEQRREIFGFLMSTNLAGTLKMASTKLDTMLLGALGTPAAVALYRFALQFARAPLLLSDALYAAVFPTFARAAAQGRRREIRNVARSSTLILCLTLLPGSLLAAAFGGDILSLMGGERYRASGTVFAICVLSVLPYGVLFWLRPLILTAGHANVLLRYQAIGTALQMLLLVLLAPGLGAEGAAIALAAGNILIVGQQLAFVRRARLLEVEPVNA